MPMILNTTYMWMTCKCISPAQSSLSSRSIYPITDLTSQKTLRFSVQTLHSWFPLLQTRPCQASSSFLGLFPTFQLFAKSKTWTLPLTSSPSHSPRTVDSTWSAFKFICFSFPFTSSSLPCSCHHHLFPEPLTVILPPNCQHQSSIYTVLKIQKVAGRGGSRL